ncbi:MAG: type II toxin-antitoxin system PemK/MazF family toxin [Bacteroidota bacterium]
MRQCNIWYADLNPVKGIEQRGVRPVVVVGGNAMNDHFKVGIVCPLTTNVKNYAGCIVLEPDEQNNLSATSEVLTFQIRTIARSRFQNKIGEITIEQLEVIKKGLLDILEY